MTDNSTEALVERLNHWAQRGKLLQPYDVKPLLRAAADLITTLRAENDAMVEALCDIVENEQFKSILRWDAARLALAQHAKKGETDA